MTYLADDNSNGNMIFYISNKRLLIVPMRKKMILVVLCVYIS